jgi:hypothetical protein
LRQEICDDDTCLKTNFDVVLRLQLENLKLDGEALFFAEMIEDKFFVIRKTILG